MKSVLTCLLFLVLTGSAFPQKKKPEPPPGPLLVRTTSKHETRRFPYGSTLTVSGAPAGSITIQSWPKSEIDIVAEIRLQAPTEADLDRLAAVNTIMMDEDANHIRIVTTGTHDKTFMKAVKKFPRELLTMPWSVDYRIRVPEMTDLDINSGRGPVTITDVEGNIQLSAAEGELKLHLSGGEVNAIVGIGNVNLSVPSRTWRRGIVEIRVAAGNVTVDLPAGFAADIDAEVLRTGEIINSYGLESREKPGITPRLVKARAGAGGSFLRFTVGDGTINVKKSEP